MQFYQTESAYVRFDVGIPRGASVGIYGRRNALPTHTSYDFLQVFSGYKIKTPLQQRPSRSSAVSKISTLWKIFTALFFLLKFKGLLIFLARLYLIGFGAYLQTYFILITHTFCKKINLSKFGNLLPVSVGQFIKAGMNVAIVDCYTSPSSGDAYSDRQLTPNFEL